LTDFLMVNSWPIEIIATDGQRSVEEIGTRGRAASGKMRRTDRAQKEVFEGTTVPLTHEVATSVEYLLRGIGWVHHFNSSLYSAVKETGPEPNYDVSIGSTGTTKFGNKVIAGVTTNTVVLEYDYSLDEVDAWTLMWWQQSGTSGTWNHYVKRSSGNAWLDGVQSNPGTASVIVTSGVVQLKGCTNAGGTGTTQCWDDLVVLPWLIADESIQHFAARTAAFSDLPRLLVTGESQQQTEIEVEGRLKSGRFIAANGNSNMRAVSFALDEV
jgi:hypothetical protein